MGIFRRLFGKKKKETPSENQRPRSSKEVSLEDVERELDDVERVDKTQPKKESIESKVEKSEPKAEPKAEQKTQEEPAGEEAVYHIKKHDDGWQLIKEGSQKPYRVFTYQKEAIDFAKEQSLDYQVYKADGTPRKK